MRSPLVALPVVLLAGSVSADEGLVEAEAFRDGYARQIGVLEDRPLALKRQKLREEIEILFMGGGLQSTTFEGPVGAFERAGLEAVQAACCPDLQACVVPLDDPDNRRRMGSAVAAAAAATGANVDPYTLGRAAGAFARIMADVPPTCACSQSDLDRVLSCAPPG